MGTTIKARFAGGVLKPLESLELPEGEEVTITIMAVPSKAHADWLAQTGWRKLPGAGWG